MYWTDAWKTGVALWKAGVALQETALAAHMVIGHRSRTIDAALRNPLEADLVELGRMVPEKIAAFGKAGLSLAESGMALQAEVLAQYRDVAMLATSSGASRKAALERIDRRSSRMTAQVATAAGQALEPIHKAATANQRRLGKRKHGMKSG